MALVSFALPIDTLLMPLATTRPAAIAPGSRLMAVRATGSGSGANYRSQFASNSFSSRAQSPFANRSGGSSFNAGSRAPSPGFANNGFNQHFANSGFNQRSDAFRGNSFAVSSGKSSNSGGFHSFGGGHNSGSFGHEQSFKAPKYKAPKAPKSSDGGHHSSGGGHSGGHHR